MGQVAEGVEGEGMCLYPPLYIYIYIYIFQCYTDIVLQGRCCSNLQEYWSVWSDGRVRQDRGPFGTLDVSRQLGR